MKYVHKMLHILGKFNRTLRFRGNFYYFIINNIANNSGILFTNYSKRFN